MARVDVDASKSWKHPGCRINSQYHKVFRRCIDTSEYVYVNIQRKSLSGNRVTSKYFLRSPLVFSQRKFFSSCACIYTCMYVCLRIHVLRVVDQRTEVLQELFVSGGYAEHSKVPPKITGALVL